MTLEQQEILDGRKQTNAKTTGTAVVPVRKRTVLASCGIPSRITCNQTIPGAYQPWYFTYTRTKTRTDEGKQKKGK